MSPTQPNTERTNSLSHWKIAVIVMGSVLLVVVVVFVIYFCKTRRSRNVIQANTANVPLENTQYASRDIPNSGLPVPNQHHGISELQNQPPNVDNNVASHNTAHHLQGNDTHVTHATQYQGPTDQNPSPQQGNKNPGLQRNQASYTHTHNEENRFQNPLYNPIYHHHEFPNAVQGTQQQGPQFYPQNVPPPPYNPYYEYEARTTRSVSDANAQST